MAHLDFETYSAADLPLVGAWRYAEDPSTEIMIVSFELDDGTHKTFYYEDPEQLRPLFDAVERGEVIKAHNAHFERVLWEKVGVARHGWPLVPSKQWDCTAARAGMCSLPRSLEACAVALKLPVNKDTKGRQLIMKYSKPNRKGERVFPEGEDREDFAKYCRQDVIVEKKIDAVLPPLPPREKLIFRLDYAVNDRGIPVDVASLNEAMDFIDHYTEKLVSQTVDTTGVRPSQREKILEWLEDQGLGLPDLQRATVEAVINDPETRDDVRKVLMSRLEVSKAGTKKLKTMLACASEDGRVRGSFFYHGATTGRWGSGGVQFQNLARPEPGYDPAEVLENLDHLDEVYDTPLSAIASSVRGFLATDKKFVVGDYSAIEARVLAWLANEKWLLDDFKNNRDAYKTMASKIFGVGYDEVDGDKRFFGKQTVLGCGFGMGALKFAATCERFGVPITEERAAEIVTLYRSETPAITRFRNGCETTAIRAIRDGGRHKLGPTSFTIRKFGNGTRVLCWDLPSGRSLYYPEPRLERKVVFGRERDVIQYKTYYRGMWVDETTYSGRLSENVTQALARDVLCDGMISLEKGGYPLILHVHDEAGSEADDPDPRDFERRMCEVRPWASDIPLAAEAKVMKRYQK